MSNLNPALTVRSRAARIAGALVAALGLPLPAAHMPRQVSPEAAPATWVAYAMTVNRRMIELLQSDDERAVRLRTHIDSLRPAPDQSSPAIVLQLWVDSRGVVTRMEFPPFADPSANADLRGLFIGRAIGVDPPRGMLLPLNLELQTDPAPAPVGAATGADVSSRP